MPVNSAYYDTCVFGESLNSNHPEHTACAEIADPKKIKWTVAMCMELSAAEATLRELLSSFEIGCAQEGVNLVLVSVSDSKKQAKQYLGLKKQLKKLHVTSNDWTHLMAAVHAGVEHLCSTDPDFWDPANKATPQAKKKSVKVKQLIEHSVDLRITLPTELFALL